MCSMKIERNVASKRLIFNQIVIFFVVGSVFGTYWEEIMYIVRHLVETGTFEWVSRRGLLYGPFSPVYGIGAVCIYLIFYRTKLGPMECFVGGAIFGGVLEFGLSLIQEWLFRTRSWDYSDLWLNIGGRTTIPYMVVWGLLVMVFVGVVYPFIDGIYQQIPPKFVNAFCVVMAVFLVLDIGISLLAVGRQTMRRAGNPADHGLERFLDEVYDDERMRKTYSNTKEI